MNENSGKTGTGKIMISNRQFGQILRCKR